jgi:hypothetical protein
MNLMAGFFVIGQAVAAGESSQGMGVEDERGMTEESQPSEMAVHQLDNNQIRELQNILQDKGYSEVPVDGMLGLETKQALSNFQQSQGLAVTGEPDRDTLQALAPDAETQEFFGISPEFGEEGLQQEPMQQEPLQQEQPQEQWDTPSGTESEGTY